MLEPHKNDLTADLHWKNDQRSINIYGRNTEKIFLEFTGVGLNMLLIPGMKTYGYDGELTGIIDYQHGDKNELGINMDIRQMKMTDQLLGDLKITGNYSADTLGTIKSDLNAVMNDTTRLDLMVRYGKLDSQKKIRTIAHAEVFIGYQPIQFFADRRRVGQHLFR